MDPTAISQIGLRTLAPTSRSLCRGCNFPDTDYLCSHLLHPKITGRPSTINPGRRTINTALCDLGRADISSPSQCHAGGHPCWERILEPEADAPVLPPAPLALPEALDFLDTAWRLWKGKKQPLFQVKSTRGSAELALSCTTRDECMSRLTALADTLKSMTIPDDLLLEKDRQVPGDQTFTRLLACLKPHLEEADYQPCEQAVGVLRAVNGVRTAFQHSGAARELPIILEKLAISYPPPSWGETWDRIRAKTVEALGIIRETVRRLATL
jgi:hypothetical protein